MISFLSSSSHLMAHQQSCLKVFILGFVVMCMSECQQWIFFANLEGWVLCRTFRYSVSAGPSYGKLTSHSLLLEKQKSVNTMRPLQNKTSKKIKKKQNKVNRHWTLIYLQTGLSGIKQLFGVLALRVYWRTGHCEF